MAHNLITRRLTDFESGFPSAARYRCLHLHNSIMVGPPKKKKGKKAASPPAMFAIDYAADLGKVVKMPGSFWNLRGAHPQQR